MQIRLLANNTSSFTTIPRAKCEIKHAAHCNHSLGEIPKRPGSWKFNSYFLEDDEYTEKLMFLPAEFYKFFWNDISQ